MMIFTPFPRSEVMCTDVDYLILSNKAMVWLKLNNKEYKHINYSFCETTCTSFLVLYLKELKQSFTMTARK